MGENTLLFTMIATEKMILNMRDEQDSGEGAVQEW